MKHKVEALILLVAVLLVLVGVETFVLTTIQAQDHQTIPIRVACVGDSITASTEYPVDLWQLLGSSYVIGNFGIGGATVSLGLDSSWMNETGFQVAKQFQPNIVVVILGTNDANTLYNETKSDFIAGYIALVSEFQTLASKPKVYLVLPPPIFSNNASLSQTYFMETVIPSIRQVAGQAGLPLIDAYTPLLDNSKVFEDGVHPNAEGAYIIARNVYAELRSVSA
jgi:acyl-CoA thioesterase-1